jgi:hypothetical protein
MRPTRSQLAAASWNALDRRSLLSSAAARAAVLSSRLRISLRSVDVGATQKRVVQPFGTAEPEHLMRIVMAVGAEHDLHLRPVAVTPLASG